jgi:hypothetical protein
VAHPDGLVGFDAVEQAIARRDRHVRRPVLTLGRGEHVSPEFARHELRAVADAEDRDPASPHGWIGFRCILVVDGVRAAAEDDGLRAAPLQLIEWGVVRQQLGVDVELAHAAGDELGELAAEVEHDHRSGRDRRRAAGAIVWGAVGSRRLERGLEVRLDLGIVGSEDAVARVGRLAVDRLAAVARAEPPLR